MECGSRCLGKSQMCWRNTGEAAGGAGVVCEGSGESQVQRDS